MGVKIFLAYSPLRHDSATHLYQFISWVTNHKSSNPIKVCREGMCGHAVDITKTIFIALPWNGVGIVQSYIFILEWDCFVHMNL